jgi:hypothetical protein
MGRPARAVPAALLAATAIAAVASLGESAGQGPPATATSNISGYDWRLPGGLTPAGNSGFYHEYAEPGSRIDARSIDVTWRQIEPREDAFDTGARSSPIYPHWAKFAPLRRQLADERRFWLRLFASDVHWAPRWLASACQYRTVGPDETEHKLHVPIWDPCVWSKLRRAWRWLLLEQDVRNDPRLVMVYVPGGFAYVEFDYDVINSAMRKGLTFAAYKAWHEQMVRDLIAIMNGENDDPSDDRAYKLVYTGEDYPYSDFGDRVAFFARDAVAAGMGIRNGITEVFNHHLGEAPAYGSHIGDDGHLHTDESWPLLADRRRVTGSENECYTTCGLHSKDPAYALVTSNLKALQLRVNWLYTLPEDRYGGHKLRSHFAWVRQELGRHVEDAPDAWVALRDGEDRYWLDRLHEGDPVRRWHGFPFVRNYERWIVQRDAGPDGFPRRGTLLHRNDPSKDNGRSYETLRTNLATGDPRIYLDVDDRFLGAAANAPVDVKVTYRDFARRSWRLLFRGAGGQTLATPLVRGRTRGRGALRTVTFRLTAPGFDNGLAGGTDIALEAVRGNLEASFVRVVKLPA